MPRHSWTGERRRDLQVIAVPCGIGAGDRGTALAIEDLRAGGLVSRLQRHGMTVAWRDVAGEAEAYACPGTRRECVVAIAEDLSFLVERAVSAGDRFLVLGGDHSIAAGTWSGAARARQLQGPIGLVWIDAHMDAHVPETSPTGNWHGMPIAHLLGFGHHKLKTLAGPLPAIRPENLCLIGARSFEPQEATLLDRLGVRIITMDEVRCEGIAHALAIGLDIAGRGTVGFGISLDIDAIDPVDAPGVGTPVSGGISGTAMLQALAGTASLANCIGLEVVEYNPLADLGRRTGRLVESLVASAFLRNVEALAATSPAVSA
jgi:arginase